MFRWKMPESSPAAHTLRSVGVTQPESQPGGEPTVPGIDECLLEAMRLPGARGAALVDWTSGLALGTVGESPGGDQEAAAVEAAELARLAAEHPAFAAAAGEAGDGDGADPPVED